MIRRFLAPQEPHDLDDPLLRARLKSLLGDEVAPVALVESVERLARSPAAAPAPRVATTPAPDRSALSELLPALCGVGLCGSLVLGACLNLPISAAFRSLGSSGVGGGLSFLGILALGLLTPLFILVLFETLRGAPTLRRLSR